MLYQPHELEISQSYLQNVVSKLNKPVCILGGWAVYLTVTENFRQEHGRDYLGSRDIDLGFRLEKNWKRADLERSDFALTMKTLSEMGFEPLGFRFVKHFRIDTYEELKSEHAKNMPLHEMFDLYVDPVVDHIHPEVREVFGFVPIDEPLLDHVFVGHRYRLSDALGTTSLLPLPDVLLATKLRSVAQRDKVHKRIKDIADIFALSWYSDERLPALREALVAMIPADETRTLVDSFTGEDLSAVSNALGIETHQIQRILSELKH